MQLRLFHKLFLLVACTALIAAAAMAIVLSLNLKRGFADYLNARDDEQLRAFVEAATRTIAANGSAQQLQDGSLAWTALLAEMARNGDVAGAEAGGIRWPHRQANGESLPRPLARRLARESWQESPLPNARRRHPPESFAMRLRIVDARGQLVMGPKPAPRGTMLERPIVLDGKILATAQMLPRGPLPNNVDALFLQRQYRAASLLTLLLLALASVLAYFFARSGAARLLEMQRATTAIADGDLGARALISGSDELSAMGLNVNHMASKLQQLDTSRRRWLAEVSHELRTPLSVLLGELDALREQVRPLNMAAVYSLAEEAQRIERIVSDLHFLALSDLSATTCRFVPVDAIELIKKLEAKFAPDFQKAGIDLSLDFGDLKAFAVVWDPERIAQLLSNLLSNTSRYTDAPGKAVLRLQRVANRAYLTLNDSAPAVPEADLERVFEPLFRMETSRARILGGSGLGLAVSHSIVRAHQGSIQAAGSELGGLCMTVILPIDASNYG